MASGRRGVLSSLLGIHADLERMIHDVVGEGARVGSSRSWAPPADVFVTGSHLVVRLEVAGVPRDKIDVSFRKGELRVRGVRLECEDQPKEGYWQMEIANGPFERRVKVPLPVDPDRIEAVSRDGILEIRMPIVAEERQSYVRIRTDAGAQ